jgi:cobalt-zinc-cadmium resistance protein CzcA
MIGPRAYYQDELDHQSLIYPDTKEKIDTVLQVKPGITGLWQVSGRSDVNFDRRIVIDEQYARKVTFLHDVHIIAKTPLAMLTGRGESAAEPVGTDEGELMVKLRDKKEWTTAKDREELMTIMKDKILATVPSSYISMSQPIENRVNALLAGSKADIVIKVYGDDLVQLKRIGEEIAEVLKGIQGTGDLRVQRVLGLPLLEIKADRAKMARYGVSANEMLDIVETLRIGRGAGKVFEGLKRFDLVVRLDVDFSEIEYIENIPVMTSFGNTVPLGQIANIKIEEGPASITREALKRRLFVEVNIRGRDLVSYINEAKEKTSKVTGSLPEGYYIEWGGQFENFTRAKNRLALVVPIAMVIIFSMLIAAFGSARYAIGVFLVVPLAVSGGILSLVLRGKKRRKNKPTPAELR